MKMTLTIRYIGLCIIASLALACVPKSIDQAKELRIAVTIAPTASLVAQIAGSTAQVTTLLPQGNTPETYEPTPKDMTELAQASAYLYVGDLGFERSWLERIQELYPELPAIRLAEACTHEGVGDGHDHDHDPHYWTGIRGIRSMATAVYHSLSQLAPEYDSLYRANYTELLGQIDSLEVEVRQSLAQVSTRAFVIYHPSLTDFAREFNFRQLVIEQNGKEPTPQHLQNIVQQARGLGVTTVFIQKEFDQKLTSSIAQELGAREITINPLASDWAEQLRLISHALRDQ